VGEVAITTNAVVNTVPVEVMLLISNAEGTKETTIEEVTTNAGVVAGATSRAGMAATTTRGGSPGLRVIGSLSAERATRKVLPLRCLSTIRAIIRRWPKRPVSLWVKRSRSIFNVGLSQGAAISPLRDAWRRRSRIRQRGKSSGSAALHNSSLKGITPHRVPVRAMANSAELRSNWGKSWNSSSDSSARAMESNSWRIANSIKIDKITSRRIEESCMAKLSQLSLSLKLQIQIYQKKNSKKERLLNNSKSLIRNVEENRSIKQS
jgi:hypothetical protein